MSQGGVREAGADDAAGLAALLRAAPQAGRLVLGQDRTIDVFARRRAFAEATTLVADADAPGPGPHPDAAVTVAVKQVRVAGQQVVAGYVFDLAVAPRARRRGLSARLLAAAHDWARGRGAVLAYCHVEADNGPSQAAFARAGYHPAGRVVTRIVPAHRRRPSPPPGRLELTDWDHAAALLTRGASHHDLAVPLTGTDLRERWETLPGWCGQDAWSTGRSLLALWDRRAVVRHVPERLPPEIRLLGAVAKAAARVGVAFPTAPRPGRAVTTGYLLGGVGDERELSSLFRAALGRARQRGLDHVVAFHDQRSRPAWLRATIQVSETYLLLARDLAGGHPSAELGRRPVMVDPLDM